MRPTPQLDRAASAVLAFPHRTDAAIAEQAGCSRASVWRARRQLEAAGVIPADPHQPGAAATRQLVLNPARSNRLIAEQAGCDEATVRRARARLEQGGQALATLITDREWRGPPGQPPGPVRKPPQIPDLPAPPDWSEGRCAHVPASQAGWWTSSDPVLREAAAHICETCPILAECAAWSLALPVTDPAVYGAMTQAERLRRKHEARAAAAEAKPSPRRL